MYEKYVKRVFDIAIALAGFPIFLLLALIIGISIKFEDRGPVFYVAERIGKNGRLFVCISFVI